MALVFLLELANSLFLVYASTEVALGNTPRGVLLGTARGTKWLPYPTQVWLALNLVALAAGLLTPLYTLLSAPIAAVGYFAEMIIHGLGAASVLCAIVSGMVLLGCRSKIRVSAARLCAVWMLLTAVSRVGLYASGIVPSDKLAGIFEKMLVVGIAFGAMGYWDVARAIPHLSTSEFVGYLAVACAEAIILLPLVTVAVATFCLVIAVFVESLGVPTAWLNAPIYVFASTYRLDPSTF
eukprot:CAMPEP_0198216488 /NCGR_PEP_ID=MMETSP1445-20131203/57762_1 /TAXON_ID=36898 /ORGANISM="Pyramimonas sp., Strain CCMP2087" /LENGTH=237 /DNA_ID=CAMNT_0043892747 /DNA_START=297 /DNA_END=1011 /DNA_ORIENTATION=+